METMKKDTLPNSFQKRKILFDKKPLPEQLITYGECFLEAGHLHEAAEFFLKASHKEGLNRLKGLAKEQGDSFLFEVVTRKAGSAAGDLKQEWEEVGNTAMGLKKYSHALRAFTRAGNESAKKQAQEALEEVFTLEQT